MLVADGEHLIQTAVGGWVREAGKRDISRLRHFLDAYAAVIPRTALRFAIELLGPDERRHYRELKSAVVVADTYAADHIPPKGKK